MFGERSCFLSTIVWKKTELDFLCPVDTVTRCKEIVRKDTAVKSIEFLEEKLSIIGLSDRERNEFIMYWLPILEQNEMSIVKYTLTDELQNKNALIIEPKPDSLLRVNIDIKKVDKEIKINKQELPTFNRTGFTAIEWGGTIY